MTSRNRNILIITITFLLLFGVILFFVTTNKTTIPESGGSGQPDPGTLILKNVESPTKDSDAIPLSSFLTTDQQNLVRDQLEAVLALKKPLDVYNGTVIDGSVAVDYTTNDVTFEVHIVELNTTYKVTANTVSDNVVIVNSDGKKVN